MAQSIYITDDLVIPRGIVYFDPFNASGATTGEIDLGETGGSTISPQTDSLTYFSSRSKLRQQIRDVPTSIARTFALTIDNISMFNLGMFLIADASVVTQTATPVVGEPFTALKGRTYQLGGLTPARNVTAVAVKVGVATKVLNTDYTLDAANGRVTVLTAGSIADNDAMTVDYTPTAETRNRLISGTTPKIGALRIVSDAAEGKNKHIYMPKVIMKPSGEMPVIAADDAWQQMAFEVGIQVKTGFAALYVDDQAIG
ncbi:MAG: hypothetical protein AB7O86_14915 [Porticoccaceae bacterium]